MLPPMPWHARGLLFENCTCTIVCPGHIHFEQPCTHDRCLGFWAIRFDEGTFGDVPLAGVKAVISFDAPKRMIDGDWTEVIIIDQAATEAQRQAVESILIGRAGGPWAVLSRFVGRWLDTKVAAIEIDDEETTKKARIVGLFEGIVTAIRGRDRSKPVTFENIFNQIHPPSQVIAQGSSAYDDGVLRYRNTGSHGLYSRFEWRVDEMQKAEGTKAESGRR